MLRDLKTGSPDQRSISLIQAQLKVWQEHFVPYRTIKIVNMFDLDESPSTPQVAPQSSVLTEWQTLITNQQQQLTLAVARLADNVNTLTTAKLQAHKPAKTKATKTKTTTVVILQKGERRVRVVDRAPRPQNRGSCHVLCRDWATEADAQTFWRELSPHCTYKLRQRREHWQVLYEKHNSKKHDYLPTQFRSSDELVDQEASLVATPA